ncbi:hypothetical protein ZWY2020_027710 [Hordeum vulgare]|nr:hypothetical protein ZWY2020_027710 [Hordeum vulgare]
MVALKQDVAEALAAVRRCDGAPLASAVRAQRRAGKELACLAAATRECASRPSRLSILDGGQGSAAEVEVTGLLMESAAATATASAALLGISVALSLRPRAELGGIYIGCRTLCCWLPSCAAPVPSSAQAHRGTRERGKMAMMC